MFGKLMRRVFVATALVVTLAGITTATAASGTIYRLSGTVLGSVTTVGSGAGVVATVNIQNGQAGTSYSVCVTSPFLQANGACPATSTVASSSAPSIACIPVVLPDGTPACVPVGIGGSGVACVVDPTTGLAVCFSNNAGAIAAGTVTTDANGNGSATITVPEALSVGIFVVTNVANPNDNGQAVVVGP